MSDVERAALACGILFSNYGAGPHDDTGCVMPERHAGPHEFVCRYGRRIRWETDWACDRCDEDRCDGDWCAIWWEVPPPDGKDQASGVIC